jgi:hypothetical protein
VPFKFLWLVWQQRKQQFLATPIPKYKMGRKQVLQVAEVGDGGVAEVIFVLMVQVLNDT